MGEEDASQETGKGLDPGLNSVASDGGDQIETGGEAGDADVVGSTGFEFPAVAVAFEALQKVVLGWKDDILPA